MATVMKIHSASFPGGWLLVISAPSIERSPAAESRGSEAAAAPSGVAEECGCQSHVLNVAAMTVVGLKWAGRESCGNGNLQEQSIIVLIFVRTGAVALGLMCKITYNFFILMSMF